jgi:acyl-CoA synthetase (AMP-forming)/AMP-acid ligase II
VRDVVLGDFTHMEIPFQTILEHVGAVPRRSEQRGHQNPLFQVMFAWESLEPVAEKSTDPGAMHLDEIALSPHTPPKFDLMLSMCYALDSNGRKVLEGVMEYPAALFAHDTALVAHDETIASLQSVPIGRPIDSHFVVILDAHKRLMPVNVPGELYIGGHGVAKGYWNRAARDPEFALDPLGGTGRRSTRPHSTAKACWLCTAQQ